jgi:hypothetical protein
MKMALTQEMGIADSLSNIPTLTMDVASFIAAAQERRILIRVSSVERIDSIGLSDTLPNAPRL